MIVLDSLESTVDVTAEPLRANIVSKSAISLQQGPGPVDTKFHVHCVSKYIPDIFSCNSRNLCRIFIIFVTHLPRN